MPGEYKSVAVYHLPTTAGAVQSYPASADATYTARMLPMDRRDHALEGIDLVDPWELYFTDPSADVRVGDKLVIDSTIYSVKKVFNASYFGGLRHKRVSVSTAL